MKTLLAAIALCLLSLPGAWAFDAATEAVIASQKIGKPVAIEDVARLMQASERWCYLEEAGSCAWTDVYLDVSPDGAEYEIGNAWDATIDIALIAHGRFENGQAICETANDWLASVRAMRRDDASLVGGRALRDLKAEIAAVVGPPSQDCFDYVFRGVDTATQTITLLQRQSSDGVHDPAQDTLVTLHFDPETAAQLSLRW